MKEWLLRYQSEVKLAADVDGDDAIAVDHDPNGGLNCDVPGVVAAVNVVVLAVCSVYLQLTPVVEVRDSDL